MDKKWAALLVIALLVVAGWWYRNQQPARVQAVIADVRDASNVNHVMTVEAISEGGDAVVGRSISISNARVTEVTGQRTFWVAGSEGDPLLVVIAPSRDFAKLAPGEHVSLSGLVRAGPSKYSLSTEDQAQVAKAKLHILATDVQQIH